MINTIIEFLSVNNSVPVVVIVIAGFVLMSFVQAHYIMTSKVNEIKKETRGKIEKYIDSVMLSIEEQSYLNAKAIMEERWSEISSCDHDEDESSCDFIKRFYPMEEDKFRDILHGALTKTRASVMQHIDINGFHNKKSSELDVYCEGVGIELFDYNKRVLKLKGIDSLVLVKDTHGLRFTRQQSIECYRDIIDEVIRLENEEKELIADVKQRLKINGKIFNFFRGYLDGNN